MDQERHSLELIDLIPVGSNNRITSNELSKLTGISGANIRIEINKMRAKFHPIASDSRGYYIAEDSEDLNHTIAHMNHRIHKMIVAREGLKKAARSMGGVNDDKH